MWSLNQTTEPSTAATIGPSPSPIVKASGRIFGNLEFVAFDANIDCPPHACYNCWSFNHLDRDCREPKLREYCCNCGRKDVRIDECPRCSKSFYCQESSMRKWIYCTFLKKENNEDDKLTIATDLGTDVDENWDGNEEQSFYSCDLDNQKSTNSCKKPDGYGSEPPPVYNEPNNLFTYLRTSKVADEITNDVVNLDDTRMADCNSFNANSQISGEDSSKKVVDEKENSKMGGELLQDFLSLMEAVKHMSVGTQEVVVLQFMAERKKLSEMQSDDKSK